MEDCILSGGGYTWKFPVQWNGLASSEPRWGSGTGEGPRLQPDSLSEHPSQFPLVLSQLALCPTMPGRALSQRTPGRLRWLSLEIGLFYGWGGRILLGWGWGHAGAGR
jgi:hypothetical protein